MFEHFYKSIDVCNALVLKHYKLFPVLNQLIQLQEYYTCRSMCDRYPKTLVPDQEFNLIAWSQPIGLLFEVAQLAVGMRMGTTWFREPPTNITLSERGNSFKFHCLHHLALATVSLLGLHCAKLFHAYSYQQYSASLNNWGYMLIDSGLLFWGESCRQTDDSSYLDWHGFCGAVEACSQSFLHCINALISVARHLNICNSQSRAGEGRGGSVS